MNFKHLFLGFLITIFLTIVSLYTLQLPAQAYSFSLGDKTSDIVTSISGIVSPLLTIVSIIFLYLAFNKQLEANKQLKIDGEEQAKLNKIQTQKMDAEYVLMFYERFMKDLDAFIFQKPAGGGANETGHRGFFKFCVYASNYKIDHIKGAPELTYMFYLRDSLILLKEQINQLDSNNPIKKRLENNLRSFFYAVLFYGLRQILVNKDENDPITQELIVFFKVYPS
ncbi:hypothetical protein SAMN06297358_0638 [Pedobacter xixiisoli]|uniref:Phage abortive infection protein n=2 Tax=Pedobacter xixiisoli TaxID=1476464 RepID=A0A285ZRU9_9SPHI|nr:hypothetical protein SAMN06297358_0638 [Pedobacter xixiisoli]